MIYIPNNRAVNEAKGVKTMDVQTVYKMLKHEECFQGAVKHNSSNEVRMILRNNGFSYSFELADALLEYAAMASATK